MRTLLKAADLTPANYEHLADEIQQRISFGVGRKNKEPVDDPVLSEIAGNPFFQQQGLVKMAEEQLGTVGSGNHYVDVLEDETDHRLWIAVHFGSRGFGWKTAQGFMNVAQGKQFDARSGSESMDAPPLLLAVQQPSGQDYIAAMQTAGRYAYAGRSAVVKKVLQILGTGEDFIVHNHHNFAWFEPHDGGMWVVRKGATPAFPGQWGFVGGSMGDLSVVIRGKESKESAAALYSTIHGAGRVMSRTQAAGKQVWSRAAWACGNYRQCDFSAPVSQFERGENDARPLCPKCGSKLQKRGARQQVRTGGQVDFQGEKQKLQSRGIILRGAGADEAPPVYRPLESVLQAHAGTIDVVHRLQPRVVVMAGSDEFDPYKD